MMLVLGWRRPDPSLVARWRGPDGHAAASALDVPLMPLAAIVGPPGEAGSAGADGPVGPAGPTGPQGNAGTSGATGPPGGSGPAGPVGPAGPQGPAGPAGAAALTGAAVLTLPGGAGATDTEEIVAATGVTAASRIFLALAPAQGQADENDPELLDPLLLCGEPSTDQIRIIARFAAPVSGPVRLIWSAF